ncbi:SPOR domain-containing protein [Providencia stuartii]|uniref:SPOR domain-containing protein n=1 Tax=Providencia stuartii TaxID=588 RepID=UPI0013D49C43|nr:SPOR domain-containing protein [Providencia stuartii]UQZ11636.1 SPOR domain-containing protein [Providencia stuartii]HEM6841892.1 SPOR domain-containing protein [Providencia stuartii]
MFISQHHCSIAKFAILSTVFAGAVVCQSVAQAQRTPVEIIHDMGVQLINGDGVPVDLIKGRYYIHQSAIRGYPLGQLHLGILFYFGDGGVQNTACAQWWLEKALQAEGEVHDIAKDFLSDIQKETAMLSSSSRVLMTVPDQKLCQQLPKIANDHIGVHPFKLEPKPESKIDLVLLQKAIISVPIFDPTIQSLKRNQFQTKIAAIPSLSHVIRSSIEIYDDALNGLSKKWILLSRHILNNQGKGRELLVNNQVSVEQINPVGIVNHSPEKTEQVTSAIPLSPEQQGELAKHATVPMAPSIEGSANVKEKVADSLNSEVSEKRVDTKLTNLASTLSNLPKDGIFHFRIELKETVVKEEAASGMEKTVEVAKKPSSDMKPMYNLGGDPRTASPRHYTLQIGSASSPAGLYEHARRHKLSNYLVYETVRHGRQWYVLVYGEFSNIASAKRALKNLPSAIQRDKPWVRSLRHVQSELH